MQRRLITIYLSLLMVTTVGLAIPLCFSVLERASSAMVLDRTADAARFSSIAAGAVVTGETGIIEAELAAYEQLFGIQALVVDADAAPVAGSSPDLALKDLHADREEVLDEAVLFALAGTRQGTEQRIWPWDPEPLLVAWPVDDGGETIGAVVISSPTNALRRSVALSWLAVAAGVLGVLALGAWAARPLSSWVLRPINELSDAAGAVMRGELSTRVSEFTGPGELQHLAGAFNRMTTTIDEMLHRQRQFVAYAGHQIRNPLAVVRLRVDSLGSHLPDDQQGDHLLALDEIDRLTRTCAGLLALARSRDHELDRVEVDLQEVARQRVRAWEPFARMRGAALIDEVPAGLRVSSVEHTLDQTLDVLLDNALKFGGQGVRIEVAARRAADGTITLTVADDGLGLPKESLARAIVPFWREGEDVGPQGQARTDAPGGTGLGLSAIVTLLEIDGGSLRLEQVEPHGIRAVVTLPGDGRS